MADTEDDAPSQPRLTALTNAANLKYSLKNYAEAAELYSRATEMQSELRGDEMAPENAELLYLYGRCLYKVAIAKSDVLGGQVAAEQKKEKKKDEVPSPNQKMAKEVLESVVEEKEGGGNSKESGGGDAKAPFFQLVDAEWSDDEHADDEEGDAEAAMEEEDDFATAFEILDIARVLLERQIAASAEDTNTTDKGKSKAKPEIPKEIRHIKERLADTYDLQSEISLENENFAAAIEDARAAVALKDELYPRASSLIAEAHFKLSLALEFESMSAIRAAQAKEGEEEAKGQEVPEVDQKLREEAAQQMEVAVESCRLRIKEEEAASVGLQGEAREKKEREIGEVREITEEMVGRLEDLRKPVLTTTTPNPFDATNDPLAALLASKIGETPAQQKMRLEEATKNANDLTGLVRKKKPTQSKEVGAGSASSNGKRKLDVPEEEGGGEKRAKTEEV